MIDLYVEYSEITVDSYHSGEQYGEWSATLDFRISGVTLTKPENGYSYESAALPEIKAGDVVRVLWMTFSSGDTFGRSTGNGEVLWVFKDPILAIRAQQAFENSIDKYSIDIETDTGEKLMLSNPAAGYFEDIGHIEISMFLVNP